MSDLIDRNNAVEVIEFKKVYMTAYKGDSSGYVSEGNPFKQYNKGLDDAIKAINNLTSIKPKSKWIPVTEALPGKKEMVLITNNKGHVRCGQYQGTFDDKNYRWWWKHNTLEEVLAWMPLPEPWRGE